MRIREMLSALLLVVAHVSATGQYSTEKLDLDGPILAWYDQELGKNNAGIVAGQYQEILRLSHRSHQFYKSDEWSVITLYFRGQQYDSTYALYDVEQDILMIRHPTDFQFHNQPIKLPQEHISWFSFQGNLFRYYEEGMLSQPAGFFHELFISEKLKLVVKRKKVIETNQDLIFEPSDQYYLYLNNQYKRVTGRFSILRALKPYKSQLKAFIKKNEISLKATAKNDTNLLKLMSFTQLLISGNE